MQQTGRFRRIAVVAHPQIPEAIKQASSVAAYLQQHGAEVAYGLLNDESLRPRFKAAAFTLFVVLVADGTRQPDK